jgi:glycerol-3-phosphate acyltransferase PlsY
MNKDISLFLLISSYLIGSIPFAVIIPQMFFGIDVREYGSKNPGTTNVYRAVKQIKGKRAAILATLLVGVLDLLKGVLPALFAPYNKMFYGLIAVVGHVYSVFLGFNGGKGIATLLGSFIGVTQDPRFLIPPIAWFAITTKKSSIKFLSNDWSEIGPLKIKTSFFISLTAMTASLLLFLALRPNKNDILYSVGMFSFICFQHIDYVTLRF